MKGHQSQTAVETDLTTLTAEPEQAIKEVIDQVLWQNEILTPQTT